MRAIHMHILNDVGNNTTYLSVATTVFACTSPSASFERFPGLSLLGQNRSTRHMNIC